MTLTEARKIIGSMGFPSKMPGTSYGLPALACIAGGRLAVLPGSICASCYALGARSQYQQPRAALGLEKRLHAITDQRWVGAMVRLLAHIHAQPQIRKDCGGQGVRRQKAGGSRYMFSPSGFHRWHDSGDLQSVEHMEKIIEVCRRTPQIRHWLPTRELAILRSCREPIPANLTIRVSATMIDGLPPPGWPGSTVHRDRPRTGAHCCPAPQQGHQCGSCRACWSGDVPLVSYKLH